VGKSIIGENRHSFTVKRRDNGESVIVIKTEDLKVATSQMPDQCQGKQGVEREPVVEIQIQELDEMSSMPY
jgi:ribosomal protein L13